MIMIWDHINAVKVIALTAINYQTIFQYQFFSIKVMWFNSKELGLNRLADNQQQNKSWSFDHFIKFYFKLIKILAF